MEIGDRGSKVLTLPECLQLLATEAKEGRHGHVGIPKEGAPLVLPVDFAVDGPDVVLGGGEALFERLVDRLVALEVDGGDRVPVAPGDAGYRAAPPALVRTAERAQ